MELKDFLVNFAEQFDDTDASEIQAETKFHELEEWGSLTGMGVIAMARTQYGKIRQLDQDVLFATTYQFPVTFK